MSKHCIKPRCDKTVFWRNCCLFSIHLVSFSPSQLLPLLILDWYSWLSPLLLRGHVFTMPKLCLSQTRQSLGGQKIHLNSHPRVINSIQPCEGFLQQNKHLITSHKTAWIIFAPVPERPPIILNVTSALEWFVTWKWVGIAIFRILMDEDTRIQKFEDHY